MADCVRCTRTAACENPPSVTTAKNARSSSRSRGSGEVGANDGFLPDGIRPSHGQPRVIDPRAPTVWICAATAIPSTTPPFPDRLHVPTVLATHLVERVSDLTQRKIFDRLHEAPENVLALARDPLKRVQATG